MLRLDYFTLSCEFFSLPVLTQLQSTMQRENKIASTRRG